MNERPWFKQYDEGVPRTLRPYPERTLVDVVNETARLRPDHPALLFKGAQVSYAELERQSDVFAAEPCEGSQPSQGWRNHLGPGRPPRVRLRRLRPGLG